MIGDEGLVAWHNAFAVRNVAPIDFVHRPGGQMGARFDAQSPHGVVHVHLTIDVVREHDSAELVARYNLAGATTGRYVMFDVDAPERVLDTIFLAHSLTSPSKIA